MDFGHIKEMFLKLADFYKDLDFQIVLKEVQNFQFHNELWPFNEYSLEANNIVLYNRFPLDFS